MTLYNVEFGTHLTEDIVDHWDAAADLTYFSDMSDFWGWAGAAGGGPTVFRNLTAYPGALRTLNELAVDHDIVILSMKPDWAASDTFAWIAEHHIPTREVHLLRDKWRVQCDLYLDDSPHALPGLVANRPEAFVCRYGRPWIEPVPGARDIHDWAEFCAFVKQEEFELSLPA